VIFIKHNMKYSFHEFIRKKLIVILIVILALDVFILNNSYGQDYLSTFYISPGCRVSWDFKNKIILGLKISIGRMVSEEYYYNFTIGRKIVIKNKLDNFSLKHYYIDVQAGSFFNHPPLSAGFGFGTAIFTKSKNKIYPRLTIFTGAGLFCSLDYVYKKNFIDLGFQAVLPIAFKEKYRKLEQ